MILHLGCGEQYLSGALNIDRHDTTVADARADARMLPVRAQTCDAVVANHLLEHLGYVGAIHALAEAFRVLRPGGRLEVETPDPQRSFEAFVADESPAHRAAVLTWIFGEDQAGQGHVLLFPEALLRKVVHESGFTDVVMQEPHTHRHRWGQRLVARRGDHPASRLVARLRPVVADQVLDGTTPQEALELERVVWAGLRTCWHDDAAPDSVLDRLLEITVVAPRVIIALAHQSDAAFLESAGGVSLASCRGVAEALREAHHVRVLRHAFCVLCAGTNDVADGYEHLRAAAVEIARAWLTQLPASPARDLSDQLEAHGVALDLPGSAMPGDLEVSAGRRDVEGRRPAWPRHELLTREHLADRARWFCDVGIRCFARGRLDEARLLFRLAVCSKVEGLYPVWNMARLQTVLGQRRNAQAFYRGALDFPLPQRLEARIRDEEQRCAAGEVFADPVAVGTGVDRR